MPAASVLLSYSWNLERKSIRQRATRQGLLGEVTHMDTIDSRRTTARVRQSERRAAPAAEEERAERVTCGLSSEVVAIMTTEHYNLQSGRSMTVADANGRASLFLGTVSTSLIALAFVGSMSHSGTVVGEGVYAFALVLLPSLMFLGVVTFERVLQSAIEDTFYARGINRIRHLYQEQAPEMLPYFILSAHDDDDGIMGNMAMTWNWWQMFLTTAGMIAVIISVLAGAFVGLLLAALFTQLPLGITVGIGGVIFVACVVLLQRSQWVRWERNSAHVSVRFPSGPED